VLSNTATRPGQLTFRRELVNLEKGTICSVTECSVGQVVQAAHIMPYLSETDNHPENGILMRSDIHILFDRYLLGIHPQTLKISLAPQIIESQNYYSLHGIKLKNNHKLSASALEKRWQWFLSKNSDAYIKA
ncbi:MAG: HNH endonuclease, partial [Methylobacter sp.]